MNAPFDCWLVGWSRPSFCGESINPFMCVGHGSQVKGVECFLVGSVPSSSHRHHHHLGRKAFSPSISLLNLNDRIVTWFGPPLQ